MRFLPTTINKSEKFSSTQVWCNCIIIRPLETFLTTVSEKNKVITGLVVQGWGESVSTICVGKNTRNYIQYLLILVLFTFFTCCILRCLACIIVSCLVCIVVILCVFVVLCMYCCFCFRCRTAG